jgi:hypothetical protein
MTEKKDNVRSVWPIEYLFNCGKISSDLRDAAERFRNHYEKSIYPAMYAKAYQYGLVVDGGKTTDPLDSTSRSFYTGLFNKAKNMLNQEQASVVNQVVIEYYTITDIAGLAGVKNSRIKARLIKTLRDGLQVLADHYMGKAIPDKKEPKKLQVL